MGSGTGKWKKLRDCPLPLAGHVVSAAANKLFYYSGWSSGKFDKTYIVYHIDSDTWTAPELELTNCKMHERGNDTSSCVTWNNWMLVYGGYKPMHGFLDHLVAIKMSERAWSPELHHKYPPQDRALVMTALLVRHRIEHIKKVPRRLYLVILSFVLPHPSTER